MKLIMVPNKYSWHLFFLLLFAFVYAHQKKYDSPTPVSRLDLLHALYHYHTFNIDAYHTNTPDKAVYQGRYYSDKAPGTVALAYPAFALAYAFGKAHPEQYENPTPWLRCSWITCAGSIAIITALGGAALFSWLIPWVGARPALITILALYLGAAPLPYSTMMFSHALVIGLISIAIWSLNLGKISTAKVAADVNPLTSISGQTKTVLLGSLCGL
jgi:hypothetical protein